MNPSLANCMETYYVYILECKDKHNQITYYTGYTKDLTSRFLQHSQGKGARYTKGKKVKLVHFETFDDQGDAMRRELEIKKLSQDQKKDLWQ